MSEEKKKGFLRRLFSHDSKPRASDDSKIDSKKRNNLQRSRTVAGDPVAAKREAAAANREPIRPLKKPVPTVAVTEATPSSEESQQATSAELLAIQRRKKERSPRSKELSRRKKQKQKLAAGMVDVSKPLEWPCTPETILDYHKLKNFLTPNEEWLIVELNEFECLIESLNIVREIAKTSKYLEIDPDELCEEFFEFVEEVPCYDDMINIDVWQEFRDKKYPC